MKMKVMKPQLSVSPDSSGNKQESRGLRIIQYFTKTVAGSSSKEPNTSHHASDNEESDEEIYSHAKPGSSSSSGTPRRGLLQKISDSFVKNESSYTDEEKVHIQNEGSYAWGVSKSVLEVSKGVAADLKGSFGGRLAQMKGMLIEKLASMPTIPADSLEHARHSIESIIADATQSAYGKTKDAMLRVRFKLVEIIPSLSPHETKKIVDDVEREVNDMVKADSADNRQQAKAKVANEDGRLGVSAATASAAIAPQPTSGLTANMDRLKAWALLRSRL